MSTHTPEERLAWMEAQVRGPETQFVRRPVYTRAKEGDIVKVGELEVKNEGPNRKQRRILASRTGKPVAASVNVPWRAR